MIILPFQTRNKKQVPLFPPLNIHTHFSLGKLGVRKENAFFGKGFLPKKAKGENDYEQFQQPD